MGLPSVLSTRTPVRTPVLACPDNEGAPSAATKTAATAVSRAESARLMLGWRLTNRASAAGAGLAGAPCARSFYGTRRAHKRNSSLLGRARQLQALVRQREFI